MLIHHFQQHGGQQQLFGESRPTNFVFGKIANALGKIKGEASAAKEQAGLLTRAGRWLVTPKSVLGLWRLPIMTPYYSAVGAKRLVSGANNMATSGAQRGYEGIKPYAMKYGKWTGMGGYRVAEAGFNLTIAPLLEIAKANGLLMPKRLIADNVRTSVRALFGPVGTAFEETGNFTKASVLAPFKFAGGVRDTIFGVLKTPRALWNKDWKGAGKNILEPLGKTGKSISDIPVSAIKIPLNIGADIALSGLEAGKNFAGGFAAPVEGVANSYGRMAKVKKLFDFIRGEVKTRRERLSEIFSWNFGGFKPAMATV